MLTAHSPRRRQRHSLDLSQIKLGAGVGCAGLHAQAALTRLVRSSTVPCSAATWPMGRLKWAYRHALVTTCLRQDEQWLLVGDQALPTVSVLVKHSHMPLRLLSPGIAHGVARCRVTQQSSAICKLQPVVEECCVTSTSRPWLYHVCLC